MWRTNTLEKPSCWERLRKVEGEGDNKRWDGWMASLTWWTWVKASFSCWLWTGKPGVLQSKGSQFNSVQFSHSVVSFLQPHRLQHARLPYPSPTPGAFSNSCPSSQWCHSTISSSVVPFSPCLQSFPASGSFQWASSSHHVAKVLELQHQSFQWIFRVDFLEDGPIGSPCCPRDSQETSPAPQFKTINYLALSFLYGSTLTSIHDYWKKHSFDYTDLCKYCLCFLKCYLGLV